MTTPKCGLCGRKEKLTVTECCNHLICDDEEDYVPFSFAFNSCHRNHKRFTLCAYHYNEQHKASDWKKCKECWDEFDPVDAEYYATNDFNFKDKIEIECTICKKNIDINIDDFAKRGGKYYCLNCNSNQDKPVQSSESQKSVQVNPQTGIEQDRIIREESKVPEQSVQNNQQNQQGESQSDATKLRNEDQINKSRDQIQVDRVNNEEQDIENRASSSLRAIRIDSAGKKTMSKASTKTVETQTIDQEMSTGKKYGKRKAQAEGDEEAKLSTRKRAGKKVKKNEDEQEDGNKKEIEIVTEKRATRSSSAKKNAQESSAKKKDEDNGDYLEDRRRSTSVAKEKPKKKVGMKRKL